MKCILLLANYRTGSSDYSYKLSHEKNVMWFPEPHLFPKDWSLLQESVAKDEPFVIKFMPDQSPVTFIFPFFHYARGKLSHPSLTYRG